MTNILGTKTETLENNGRSVGFEIITPIEAVTYLNSMPGNRPLSNKQVEYLTQQANAGKYFSNVAPIHFDTQGRLRNGQHRMWMVIESEMPQEFMVVRNATEEEIDAMDIGKKRSGGDVLALDGYSNSGVLAGSLLHLWMYENHMIPGHSRSMFSTKNAPGMTNHRMREFMALHPGMVASVDFMRATPSVRLLAAASILTFCHYGITRANKEQGAAFWASIATQNFWGQDDPAFRIYDRLTRSKNEKQSNRLALSEVAALTIKAWNFWIQGRNTVYLRWRAPGHKAHTTEEFPRIRSK